MNSFRSQNSDGFTASVPIKLANGSKDSVYEPILASHQPEPSTRNTSGNAPALSQGLSSTSGMQQERPTYSTRWVTNGPFSFQTNGSIGQTIVDADGNAIAWTTDVIVAQVICEMMNKNKGLLV